MFFHQELYRKNCILLQAALPVVEPPWLVDLVTTALMITNDYKAVLMLSEHAFEYQNNHEPPENTISKFVYQTIVKGVDHWTVCHGHLRKLLIQEGLYTPGTRNTTTTTT